MKRLNRRLAIGLGLFSLFASVLGVPAALRAADAGNHGGGGKLPPERTYSNAPYVHRIFLRDDEGNLITAPKLDKDGKLDPASPNKPFSTTTTCGKCHADVPVMAQGWHFNAGRADVPNGRPGEPWLLTDPNTRTQLPLSYRGWKGTFHPYDVGINDFNFARLFARHHPGGGALADSHDLRFKMAGKLEIDCLVCHTNDLRHDQVLRAKQVEAGKENFRYAPTVASRVGSVSEGANTARFKDTWDPTNPNSPPAPKVTYDPDRFDGDYVTFNVSRRIPNDRCYFCHTSIDVGRPGAGNDGLETRFRHDRDIHLAKGLMCVDCHRNGADHMIVRGYEGEYAARKAVQGDKADKTIQTLTCRGCHYGEGDQLGGRAAAPLPVHKGLPRLHFDKLSCTACHSGPLPGGETTAVQTSMAHRLGIPRHHTSDDAAPHIQQAVFLRVDADGQVTHDENGKITPHKVVYPAFWGRLNGSTITPVQPDLVAAVSGVQKILGDKPNPVESLGYKPLTKDQIVQVLEKLAAAKPPTVEQKNVITGRKGGAAHTPATTTTSPATVPATTQAASKPAAPVLPTPPATPPAWATGTPVYVTGGRAYKLAASGKDLEPFDNPAAAPYAWALAHDVRPAQQALGARGCTDCHAFGAPIFDAKVGSDALLADASATRPMHQVRGDSMGALMAFAATYPMRPALIAVGYICAIVLGLVLLTYAVRAVGAVTRR